MEARIKKKRSKERVQRHSIKEKHHGCGIKAGKERGEVAKEERKESCRRRGRRKGTRD